MDGSLQDVLERSMREVIASLEADERLAAERQRAWREFFGAGGDLGGRGLREAAGQRFYEWFALERESEVLGAVPIDLPRFAVHEALRGSLVGVFHVTSAGDGLAMARDLQDDELVELEAPDGSLAPGDLVVGRLFAAGVGRWLPSVAATVFRPGAALGSAFREDLERLALDRRLLQVEVEHLLLARQARPRDDVEAARPLEHLEADLEALLGEGGPSASEISEQLAQAERIGPVVGPLLETLAFDTEVDLERARRLFLEIWNAHRAGSRPETPDGEETEGGAVAERDAGPPGETLGERMVRTLEDGLRADRNIEGLFADLERMAGLEPGASDDPKNPFDDPAEAEERDGLGGNLGALVAEFLWESGGRAVKDARRPALQTWLALLQNAAVPCCDLEDITAFDVTRLLLHVYLAAAADDRAAEARMAFDEVAEFFAWAERTQEMKLSSPLDEVRSGLLDQLGRLGAAGLALSSTDREPPLPALLEVTDVGPDGFGVCGEEGQQHWISVEEGTAALLRSGDLILGAVRASAEGATFAGPVVVLPADARRLIQ